MLPDLLRSVVADRCASNRMSHALLISGPPGSGKGMLAEAIVQSQFCEASDPTGLPCGRCPACLSVAAGTKADLHWFPPEGKLGIEQARALSAEASLRPEGAVAVFVLEAAHRLTGQAAAALLKTLEDPPGPSLFLLLVDHPGQIEPTLRSRCQVVRIPPANRAVLAGWLSRCHGLESEQALGLAVAADGWPGRAIAMLPTVGPEPDAAAGLDRTDVAQVLSRLRPVAALDLAARLTEKKADALPVMTALRDVWLRQTGGLGAAGGASSLLAADDLEELASIWSPAGCLAGLVAAERSLDAASANVNALLNWEVLLFRLQNIVGAR